MEPKEVAGGQLIAATGKRQGMPGLARKPSTWGGSSTLAYLVHGPRHMCISQATKGKQGCSSDKVFSSFKDSLLQSSVLYTQYLRISTSI